MIGAAPPETGLEGLGRKVADADLAEMRGKFIEPDSVSYFGLTLATSWQGTDGITTMATIMFDVSFAAGAGNLTGASPQLMVGWMRDCGGCGDESMDVSGFGPAAQGGYIAIADSSGPSPTGGLSTVEGAVQSQRIAGSDNNVRNAMSIAILPISLISDGTADGLTPITESRALTFADGDKLQFILNPNEIALAMSGGGGDSVLQSVQGNPGQAAQHVILASDVNSISNFMGITVGLDTLLKTDAVRVQNAITAMKGHGF